VNTATMQEEAEKPPQTNKQTNKQTKTFNYKNGQSIMRNLLELFVNLLAIINILY
jgi:hypothetical protein